MESTAGVVSACSLVACVVAAFVQRRKWFTTWGPPVWRFAVTSAVVLFFAGFTLLVIAQRRA